ncbi:hypothetical protein [Nocardia cyriacigeorgica]|uniref:Uncharacterized protein n=1 Tax=Nocardia cyriacigeorgica (strain GUH-2) TaxID=1127134 RepID=H6R302_NOCCG|nr:hypothetical protein [Nocardia cyriacigeorgica]CCF64401.1 protein of unknown function [Nocardia cyriacigeorgica GUH-2]
MVAARFGRAAHVLRHWESVGLLEPDVMGPDAAATVRTTSSGSRR